MVAVGAEDADVTVFFEPAHDAVVGDVAPDEVAAGGEPGGTLGPAKAGGDALDGGVALLGEALVERFDVGARVAGAGEVAQGERLVAAEEVVAVAVWVCAHGHRSVLAAVQPM